MQFVGVLKIDTDVEIEVRLPRNLGERLDMGIISRDFNTEGWECCPDLIDCLLETLELNLSCVHSLMLGLSDPVRLT